MPDAEGTSVGKLREVHARVATRLSLLLTAASEGQGAEAPSPYIRRYLAEHAAEGGVLNRVVTSQVVHWLDVSRLREAATPETLPLMSLVRRAAHTWAFAEPWRNAAALQFLAAADGRSDVRFSSRWSIPWAKSPGASEILARDGLAFVDAVALPSGGVVVLTAGASLLVHDLRHAQAVDVFGGEQALRAAALVLGTSPERLYVVTGYDDGTVRSCPVPIDRHGRVRQPQPGEERSYPPGATVTALAPSPSGPGHVLVGRADGTISLRNVEDGWRRRVADDGAAVIGLAAMNDEEPRVLSIHADEKLRSWPLRGRPEEEEEEEPWTDFSAMPRALAVTRLRDGSPICVVAAGGGREPSSLQIAHIPLSSGRRVPIHGHDEGVTAITAWTAPSGASMAVTGDRLGRLRLVDLDKARAVGAPVAAHGRGVRSLVCAAPPGGRSVVVSLGYDGVARTWDPVELLPPATTTRGGSVGEHSEGDQLSPPIRLWQLRDGQEVGSDVPTQTHWLAGVALAELSNDSGVVVTIDSRRRAGDGFGDRIISAVVNREGGALAVTAADGVLRLWDLTPSENGVRAVPRPDQTIEHPGVWALAALTLGDGRSVAASAGRDRAVRIWDLERGSILQPEPREVKALTAVAVGTGGLFVGAGADAHVRVWDATTGKELPEHENVARKHRHPAVALGAVHLDARLLAVTGGHDGRVQCLMLDGAKEIHHLATYDVGVTALAVASGANPSAVVVALADHTVRVLELRSGRQLLAALPVPGTVRSIACLPNAPAAVIAGEDVFALVRWSAITHSDRQPRQS